ncbi:phospho-2-dehydro-3-deoxyheptonate aldolase 1, chloroplastic-like [Glycine soja]|nr:phospho-2-dehydro-3-deoxyheptonate aldolase 1, chloroplastic-like [Glycine soja]
MINNKFAINHAKNLVAHGRSKHIETRFHFLREQVKKRIIEVTHCPTQDQPANVLTKPVRVDRFLKTNGELGVGRMMGQFAKLRSKEMKETNGMKLSSYKGDNVNGDAFEEKMRIPDPERLIRAYNKSVVTLSLLKAFAMGCQWNLDFSQHNEQGDKYLELAHRIDNTLAFMAAAGLTVDHPIMKTTEFWTSHECLLLPYEQSLTRLDSTSGLYYDCSAHMLWVGERTRQLDGAHVEFLRGVIIPLALRLNASQSLELAFNISERLKKNRIGSDLNSIFSL